MKIVQMIAMSRLASGGAHQMVRLANGLANEGHEVHVIVHYDPNIPENEFTDFLNPKIHFSRMPLHKFTLNKNTFSSIKILRKYLKKHQIEIIHSHKGRATDYAYFATLGLNIPIIANRGVTNPLTFTNSLKYRSPKIKKIIAVSKAVKDIMIQTGNIPQDKIEVVYGSVDIQKFHPSISSSIREEFGISTNTFVVGFVGNAGERKGLPYLIDAFREYSKKYPDDRLLLVGTEHEHPFIQQIKNEFGNRIIIAGFRKDVPQCLKAMDLFIFTGIAEEGLTGTVREAAAMALPIICSDVAGNRELIHHMETGYLVPKRDSEAVLKGMLYLRENPELRKKLGTQARLFVEKNMSNEIRTQKILQIYQEILNEYSHH